ncbi:transcriptional regulator, partial [Thalassospira australica]|uniref:transcriptional regulator n=1 Tax=Thalassospira australica TaxID=1528106 RepID=UPI00051A57EF
MQTTYAIKTKTDYDAAMEQLENLWGANPGTPEADQMEVLGILIDQYEAQQFTFAAPEAV